MKKKEFIISTIFIIISLIVYGFFPVNGIFQQVLTMLIFFVILPWTFNKFVLKKHKSKILLYRVGNIKDGILWSLISILSVFIIFILLQYSYLFFNNYSVPVFIVNDFMKFILYEFFVVGPFVLVYEFYFRGFLMGLFEIEFKSLSVILQAIIFGVLVWFIGGQFVQYVPYLVFAPFGGWIALKSNSLIYSAASQFIIILCLNAIIIQRIG